MSRPLPKWLAIVLTVLYLPALAGFSMLIHTDLFWSVAKWVMYIIGFVGLVLILVILHWGLYKWFRKEDVVVPPIEVIPPGR